MKKETIRLKVCIIGEPSSGKTSFIRRMMNEQIIVTFPTQQYEVNLYCVEAKSFYLEVQLWDCSRGHLDYHKYLREAYFRNTSAAILIFDVGDPKWKDKAHLWISQAYENHCYLVYAIGTKDDLRNQGKKIKEEKGLFQKLNSSENSNESILEEETQRFFQKYDIKFTLQSLKEPLKKTVTQLFMRMHDQYMIVSRGSLARGLSVRMPENYNQNQIGGGTYNFTNEQRDRLKRETQK